MTGALQAFSEGRPRPAAALILGLAAPRAGIWAAWSRVDLPAPAGLLTLALLVDALFLGWQLRGAARSLTRHLSGGSSTLALWGGQAMLAAAVVLSVTAWVDAAARQGHAPVPRTPPPLPLSRAGDTLLLEGFIDYPMLARFEASTLDGITQLRLQSEGGLVYAARALAQRVTAAGLATEVTEMCLSACTLVFLAGAPRELGPDGILGFHGYRLDSGVPTLDIAREQARDGDWMAARGVNAGFRDRVAATPHDQIWQPDRATLVAAGIIAR